MNWRLGLLLVFGTTVGADTPPPEKIHFVAFARSDALGEWSDYIMDLQPADGQVAVRWIRVGPPNFICSRPVVITSHERRVDQSRYEELFAEANPCEIKSKLVERSMRARGPVDLMQHPVHVQVIATCDGERRSFDLPHLPRGQTPGNRKVSKLRDLYWDIRTEIFPDGVRFRSQDPEEDFQLQLAAQGVVPDLKAGKFDFWIDTREGGGWGGWGYAVDSYVGPVRTERLIVARLLKTDLEFVEYRAPSYPPLAISARIQGTVRLVLEFAPDGNVANAQPVDGHPMLTSSAVEAASSWRVDPSSIPTGPTEVELAFEFMCAD